MRVNFQEFQELAHPSFLTTSSSSCLSLSGARSLFIVEKLMITVLYKNILIQQERN